MHAPDPNRTPLVIFAWCVLIIGLILIVSSR